MNLVLADTKESINKMLQEVASSSIVALDTETTSLDHTTLSVVGYSVAPNESVGYYVPLNHTGMQPNQLGIEAVRKVLQISNKLVMHNSKFDILALERLGLSTHLVPEDTQAMAYCVDSEQRLGLKHLVKQYFMHEMTKYNELVSVSRNKKVPFESLPPEKVYRYACEDAVYTLKLYNYLIKKHANCLDLYEKLEKPLIAAVTDMERNGMLIDCQRMEGINKELVEASEGLLEEIKREAGSDLNVNSSKQLRELLFGQRGLVSIKKTPKGQESTNSKVLRLLSKSDTLCSKITTYRELTKLITTYTGKLPLTVSPTTGRIHGNFNQFGTATGRFSSSNPNLQNIPARSDYGKRIRECFIPSTGKVLLAADYSQMEIRILASMTNDWGLCNALDSGADIHQATASSMFGVDLDSVTKDQRRIAKTINFGIIYGQSAKGLAETISISEKDAREYIARYFMTYPKVKIWIAKQHAFMRQNGYVETILGRRRYIPEGLSDSRADRGHAERKAQNTPIQGSSADIVKKALYDIWKFIKDTSLDSDIKIIAQVHDEILIEIPESIINNKKDLDIVKEIEYRMSNTVQLKVKLPVDVKYGSNWAEAH